MAITTTTISKSPGWARTDVILQLEEAFTWAGMNGGSQQGYVIGVGGSYSGGGTVGTSSTDFYDVLPASTTGIGTGASFRVDRNSGSIYRIYVNRPGAGYTAGDTVTLSADDIGGSANGATDITLQVAIAGTVSNAVGYAISFGGTYEASGTDRNGAVSGANTTITITEGDTLTLTNYNSSSGYQVNVCWTNINESGYNYATDFNRVFNVYNQNASNSGGICTFTPYPGQSGVYYILDDGSIGVTTTTIVVQSASSGDINYTSVGSTSTFYDKGVDGGTTYPWGIARHQIQENKTFGDTYRGYEIISDTSMRTHVGSAFHPNNINYVTGLGGYATQNLSPAYPKRFAGNFMMDVPYTPVLTNVYFNGSSLLTGNYKDADDVTIAASTSYTLDLNVYRSSIDPNFVVFSYRHPDLSSSKLRDNTYYTWFNHNFASSLWDYDNLFLGGHTQILPSTSENDPYLQFRTYIVGEYYYSSGIYPSKRCAEFGYSEIASDGADFGVGYRSTTYKGNNYPDSGYTTTNTSMYTRSTGVRSAGGDGYTRLSTSNDNVSSDANFNAVVKGLPLSVNLLPVPYYLPDDFVLIDFDYASPSANIQQGDTVTISGSEVYTVIQGSYNQTTRTRGILFCARTV